MDEVNQSLQKIAKGTGIVFIGTIVGLLFGFVSRVLVARFFSQSEYGIFSLAFVILNIAVIVSTLGFKEGTTRQIAYYRGRNETIKVQEVIASSLKIALITSIPISVILFLTSGIVSTKVFNEPELSNTLKIFSAAIPFFVLIYLFASIFRGFGEVKPRVYFENILRSVLFLLLLVPVILFGLSFLEAMYAFSASIVIGCIAFAIYTLRKPPLTIKREKHLVLKSVGKELLLFSLPLLFLTMLNMTMQWTDTLMLGFFKVASDVGLYNAALPISRLTGIIMGSASFIYVPILSQFYSKGSLQEMGRNYEVITKWIFSATLPLFLIFFFFPTVVLNFFFGSQYVEASIALQILAIVFLIHAFLGPNAPALLAMGKTRFLLYASLIGAILNISLNVALIPLWGITGAATATTLSLGAAHMFNSVGLYRASKIHPFNKHYLKPIIFCILPLAVIYVIAHNFFAVTFWMLPIFFVVFIMIYAFSLLLTRSIGKEDITLLLTIEKRVGINAKLIKKVLRKFM